MESDYGCHGRRHGCLKRQICTVEMIVVAMRGDKVVAKGDYVPHQADWLSQEALYSRRMLRAV